MTPKEIAEKIRRCAADTVDTAKGSSRAPMYEHIAQELRTLAGEVEKLKS